jgi:cephalosporin hydroxylase
MSGGASLRGAAKSIEAIYKYALRRLWRLQERRRIPYRPGGRPWGADLPLRALQSLQNGALKYSYRGIPMLKNPFEVALYPILLWQAKPRTIIEIGSYLGASALWMADLMRSFGLDGQVLSIDINPPRASFQRDDIRFIAGNARRLEETLTPKLFSVLPRPLLVIEDSVHDVPTTLAVLRFFDRVLLPGEYIVVEDGLVTDLGIAHRFGGGPGRAISQFLLESQGRYQIDSAFCDHYGHNFTGNPNGYLRRVAS